MNAARSLFWILFPGIEVGIAAVWLAINAAALDSWFAELVRRIMFIGLFAFILDQDPPSREIRCRQPLSDRRRRRLGPHRQTSSTRASGREHQDVGTSEVRFMGRQCAGDRRGLRHGRGRRMLLVGRRDFRRGHGRDVCRPARRHDHAGSRRLVLHQGFCGQISCLCLLRRHEADGTGDDRQDRLRHPAGLAEAPTATSEQFITTLAIAGISVVVFVIAMYVPPILAGRGPCASIAGGMEAIRHGGQAATFAAGGAFLGASAATKGAQDGKLGAGRGLFDGGRSAPRQASGIGSAGWAAGSAAKREGHCLTRSLRRIVARARQRQARPDAAVGSAHAATSTPAHQREQITGG